MHFQATELGRILQRALSRISLLGRDDTVEWNPILQPATGCHLVRQEFQRICHLEVERPVGAETLLEAFEQDADKN